MACQCLSNTTLSGNDRSLESPAEIGFAYLVVDTAASVPSSPRTLQVADLVAGFLNKNMRWG